MNHYTGKPHGKSRDTSTWKVRSSNTARQTVNPIRQIVDGMMTRPNPEKKLITLSLGDPTVFGNFNPHDNVIQSVCEALTSGNYNGYGPSFGHATARKAVAKYVGRPTAQVNPEDVFLACGCSDAIGLAMTVLADPGDNILIPRPGFSLYQTLAVSQGIEVKHYNCIPEKSWEADLDHMEELVDDKTKLIVVVNPSNPCGSNFSKEHINAILEVAERNKIPILADEIYADIEVQSVDSPRSNDQQFDCCFYNLDKLVYPGGPTDEECWQFGHDGIGVCFCEVFSGQTFVSCASQTTTVPVLSCGGIAKRFLVPGWRLGWVVVHDRNDILGEEVRAGLVKLTQRILGPTTFIQAALPGIFSTPQSHFDETIEKIERSAKYIYERLSSIPGLQPIKPQAAMYMMVGFDQNYLNFKDDKEFTGKLLSEQSVFCLPAECFRYPNYFRLVLTVPEDQTKEACERIAEFCQKYYIE